jgi:GntR family transcriptional regulator/MocR family aminotransferase
LIDAFVKARAIVTHASSLIEQAILADFINEGQFASHVRAMRSLYAERQAVVLKEANTELGGLLDLESDEAGMDLIGWLPPGVDDQAAFRKAAANGVEVTPLSAYSIKRQRRGALRLGYTGYTPNDLRRGVRNLARALRGLKGENEIAGHC